MTEKKTLHERLQTASRKWGLTQIQSIYDGSDAGECMVL